MDQSDKSSAPRDEWLSCG